MDWFTVFLIGCSLAMQADEGPFAAPVDLADPPATLQVPDTTQPITKPQPGAVPIDLLVEDGSNVSRLNPPQLVDEALTLPAEAALSGQPLSLTAALGASVDRRQQRESVQAYWQLVEAVANYRFCFDYEMQLRQVPSEAEIVPELETAKASARAMLQQAQAEALEAQHALAARVLMASGGPLPLPADRPHVGAYRTHFDRLFSPRTAPALAVRIDRTLPLRRQAIEHRAGAVRAAEEAKQAASNAFQEDQTELADLLQCMQRCRKQRQALIATVCRYNHDIAAYALLVAPPGTPAKGLVRMLIKPSDLQPVSYDQPVPTPAQRNGAKVPTRAKRSEARQKESSDDESGWLPSESTREPESQSDDSTDTEPARPMVPVEREATDPQVRTLNKPVSAAGNDDLGVKADVSAEQLAEALYGREELEPAWGQPLSLRQCLAHQAVEGRRSLIEAYWRAGERIARYQTLRRHAAMLDAIDVSPEDRLSTCRLRSATLAAEAAASEAHASAIESQFALAAQMNRPAGAADPVPSTTPHAGPYPLKLDGQLAPSWPMRRLTAVIPALAKSARQHAAAVAKAAESDRPDSRRTVRTVNHQTEQTLAFLGQLTKYNTAIAHYTLAVLPPETSSEQLFTMLVPQ